MSLSVVVIIDNNSVTRLLHKERIEAGHVHDVFPYESDKRFSRRHPRAPESGSSGQSVPPARSPGEASKMSISTDYRRRIAEEERGAFNQLS